MYSVGKAINTFSSLQFLESAIMQRVLLLINQKFYVKKEKTECCLYETDEGKRRTCSRCRQGSYATIRSGKSALEIHQEARPSGS